jgi:hypothetical protein
MSGTSHPVESQLSGFVALFEDTRFGQGVSFGMYSRRDPDSIRGHAPEGAVVVNVKRAREIAREVHDWDLPSEDDLLEDALAG